MKNTYKNIIENSSKRVLQFGLGIAIVASGAAYAATTTEVIFGVPIPNAAQTDAPILAAEWNKIRTGMQKLANGRSLPPVVAFNQKDGEINKQWNLYGTKNAFAVQDQDSREAEKEGLKGYRFSINKETGNTKVHKDLVVNGKINSPEVCIAGDCKSAWPTGGNTGDFTSMKIDDVNERWDVWIQGGKRGGTQDERNLALLGDTQNDKLNLNYATEYKNGVNISGTTIIKTTLTTDKVEQKTAAEKAATENLAVCPATEALLKAKGPTYKCKVTEGGKLYRKNVFNAATLTAKDGKVGIGTHEPEAQLDVNGRIIARGLNNSEFKVSLHSDKKDFSTELMKRNTTRTDGRAGAFDLYHKDGLKEKKNAAGEVEMKDGKPVMENNWKHGFTSLPNGNFGIGSLNPSHKLSVNGNIWSKGIVLSQQYQSFVQLHGEQSGNAGIELKSIGEGKIGYIDFSNAKDEDFDIRIQQKDDDTLFVQNADLEIGNLKMIPGSTVPNAFACLDVEGKLFRANVPCTEVPVAVAN